MIDELFEVAKKDVERKTFEVAEFYIYTLTRNRKLTFEQFRKLNETNREAN
jgi:hypothetical protein